MLLNSQITSKTKLSRREIKAFFDKLETTRAHNDTESKVEEAVNNVLEAYLKRIYGEKNVTALKANQTDGVITVQNGLMGFFSIIVEAKRDFELGAKSADRAKILAQAISYVKRAQKRGDALPTALVLADYDEIFTVPLRLVQRYLDGNYDWTLAPSSAWQDARLFDALIADPNFNSIYVEYTHRDTFDVEHFCNRVLSYATDKNDLQKIAVDKHSLEKAFVEFQRTVFGAQTAAETEKVELFGKKKSITYAQVQIFIKSLLGDKNIYIDPVDRRTVVIVYKDHKGEERLFRYPPSSRFLFSAEAYEQFFTKYDRGQGVYDLATKKEITEIADTLFDEFDRRFTGDYWTPQIWVDEAHRMIENQLGEDWKEKYVVWDPACGAKNLTRGYEFKELYCSTLHQEELNIAEDYNPEATTFQYDFLNDDMDLHGLQFDNRNASHFKIPDELIASMKANKPIVFFANPPYGQASSAGESSKSSISKTRVEEIMRPLQLKTASMELYTQFIYRVQQFAKTFNYTGEFHFFFFFNKGFLTSPSFAKFTNQLCREFTFNDGFMLNAGEFKGTSSSWGIIFSGWTLSSNSIPQKEFLLKVKKSNSTGEISNINTWTGRLVEKEFVLSKILKKENSIKMSFPTTANGFSASRGKSVRLEKMPHDWIGYLHNNGENIQYSDKFTGMYSLGFAAGNGNPVTRTSLQQACSVFSIRKSILPYIHDNNLLWVRDKDIFTAPSVNLLSNLSFSSDCVTYSLFSQGSNQTSLRNYDYESKTWDVKNEFFWLPRDWVRTWAETDKQYDVRDDADLFTGDRYVSTWLTAHWNDTSGESQDLLKIANTILKASLKYRKSYDNLHPKYNLLTWDAGWLQVYKMCFSRDALPAAKSDEKLQRQYEKFKVARRALGDRIALQYSQDTGF